MKPSVLGRRLREARKRAGLTLVELERISGWSDSYIGMIEAGERQASPHVLRDLADALGVDRDTLAPRIYHATRVGPHVVGRCFESGWHVEEVAPW